MWMGKWASCIAQAAVQQMAVSVTRAGGLPAQFCHTQLGRNSGSRSFQLARLAARTVVHCLPNVESAAAYTIHCTRKLDCSNHWFCHLQHTSGSTGGLVDVALWQWHPMPPSPVRTSQPITLRQQGHPTGPQAAGPLPPICVHNLCKHDGAPFHRPWCCSHSGPGQAQTAVTPTQTVAWLGHRQAANQRLCSHSHPVPGPVIALAPGLGAEVRGFHSPSSAYVPPAALEQLPPSRAAHHHPSTPSRAVHHHPSPAGPPRCLTTTSGRHSSTPPAHDSLTAAERLLLQHCHSCSLQELLSLLQPTPSARSDPALDSGSHMGTVASVPSVGFWPQLCAALAETNYLMLAGASAAELDVLCHLLQRHRVRESGLWSALLSHGLAQPAQPHTMSLLSGAEWSGTLVPPALAPAAAQNLLFAARDVLAQLQSAPASYASGASAQPHLARASGASGASSQLQSAEQHVAELACGVAQVLTVQHSGTAHSDQISSAPADNALQLMGLLQQCVVHMQQPEHVMQVAVASAAMAKHGAGGGRDQAWQGAMELMQAACQRVAGLAAHAPGAVASVAARAISMAKANLHADAIAAVPHSRHAAAVNSHSGHVTHNSFSQWAGSEGQAEASWARRGASGSNPAHAWAAAAHPKPTSANAWSQLAVHASHLLDHSCTAATQAYGEPMASTEAAEAMSSIHDALHALLPLKTRPQVQYDRQQRQLQQQRRQSKASTPSGHGCYAVIDGQLMVQLPHDVHDAVQAAVRTWLHLAKSTHAMVVPSGSDAKPGPLRPHNQQAYARQGAVSLPRPTQPATNGRSGAVQPSPSTPSHSSSDQALASLHGLKQAVQLLQVLSHASPTLGKQLEMEVVDCVRSQASMAAAAVIAGLVNQPPLLLSALRQLQASVPAARHVLAALHQSGPHHSAWSQTVHALASGQSIAMSPLNSSPESHATHLQLVAAMHMCMRISENRTQADALLAQFWLLASGSSTGTHRPKVGSSHDGLAGPSMEATTADAMVSPDASGQAATNRAGFSDLDGFTIPHSGTATSDTGARCGEHNGVSMQPSAGSGLWLLPQLSGAELSGLVQHLRKAPPWVLHGGLAAQLLHAASARVASLSLNQLSELAHVLQRRLEFTQPGQEPTHTGAEATQPWPAGTVAALQELHQHVLLTLQERLIDYSTRAPWRLPPSTARLADVSLSDHNAAAELITLAHHLDRGQTGHMGSPALTVAWVDAARTCIAHGGATASQVVALMQKAPHETAHTAIRRMPPSVRKSGQSAAQPTTGPVLAAAQQLLVTAVRSLGDFSRISWQQLVDLIACSTMHMGQVGSGLLEHGDNSAAVSAAMHSLQAGLNSKLQAMVGEVGTRRGMLSVDASLATVCAVLHCATLPPPDFPTTAALWAAPASRGNLDGQARDHSRSHRRLRHMTRGQPRTPLPQPTLLWLTQVLQGGPNALITRAFTPHVRMVQLQYVARCLLPNVTEEHLRHDHGAARASKERAEVHGGLAAGALRRVSDLAGHWLEAQMDHMNKNRDATQGFSVRMLNSCEAQVVDLMSVLQSGPQSYVTPRLVRAARSLADLEAAALHPLLVLQLCCKVILWAQLQTVARGGTTPGADVDWTQDVRADAAWARGRAVQAMAAIERGYSRHVWVGGETPQPVQMVLSASVGPSTPQPAAQLGHAGRNGLTTPVQADRNGQPGVQGYASRMTLQAIKGLLSDCRQADLSPTLRFTAMLLASARNRVDVRARVAADHQESDPGRATMSGGITASQQPAGQQHWHGRPALFEQEEADLAAASPGAGAFTLDHQAGAIGSSNTTLPDCVPATAPGDAFPVAVPPHSMTSPHPAHPSDLAADTHRPVQPTLQLPAPSDPDGAERSRAHRVVRRTPNLRVSIHDHPPVPSVSGLDGRGKGTALCPALYPQDTCELGTALMHGMLASARQQALTQSMPHSSTLPPSAQTASLRQGQQQKQKQQQQHEDQLRAPDVIKGTQQKQWQQLRALLPALSASLPHLSMRRLTSLLHLAARVCPLPKHMQQDTAVSTPAQSKADCDGSTAHSTAPAARSTDSPNDIAAAAAADVDQSLLIFWRTAEQVAMRNLCHYLSGAAGPQQHRSRKLPMQRPPVAEALEPFRSMHILSWDAQLEELSRHVGNIRTRRIQPCVWHATSLLGAFHRAGCRTKPLETLLAACTDGDILRRLSPDCGAKALGALHLVGRIPTISMPQIDD